MTEDKTADNLLWLKKHLWHIGVGLLNIFLILHGKKFLKTHQEKNRTKSKSTEVFVSFIIQVTSRDKCVLQKESTGDLFVGIYKVALFHSCKLSNGH